MLNFGDEVEGYFDQSKDNLISISHHNDSSRKSAKSQTGLVEIKYFCKEQEIELESLLINHNAIIK